MSMSMERTYSNRRPPPPPPRCDDESIRQEPTNSDRSSLYYNVSTPVGTENGQINIVSRRTRFSSNAYLESDGSPVDRFLDTSQAWFWGDLDRNTAFDKLENQPDGSFLVRNSVTSGDYTLIVKHNGENRCVKIYQCNGYYGFKLEDLKFESLSSLITYYSNNTLAEFNQRMTTRLIHPIKNKEVTELDLFDALSILADRGRQLFKAQKKYTTLMTLQSEINDDLILAKMKAKGLEAAQEMFQSVLDSHASYLKDCEDDIIAYSAEQQKKLEKARSQAESRLEELNYEMVKAQDEVQKKGKEQHSIMIEINNHLALLGDKEEACYGIKLELLKCGAKSEFLDCLLDDRYLEWSWDSSLWLLDCSRQEAENLLQDKEVGTFIVRPRDDPQKPYALSVVCNKAEGLREVNHCVIFHPPGYGYGFRDNGAVFETIEELVARHAHTNLKLYFSHLDTLLMQPVKEVLESSNL